MIARESPSLSYQFPDKLVGNVIVKLIEHGLREKTLIVVMGDNGAKECFRFALDDGRALIGRKGHNRDGGEHVGLIFNQPGTVPDGDGEGQRTYEGILDVVDLFPTLLEACDIPMPASQRHASTIATVATAATIMLFIEFFLFIAFFVWW